MVSTLATPTRGDHDGLSILRIRNMYVCNDGVGAQRSAEGPGEYGDAPYCGLAVAAGHDSACWVLH